MDSVRYGAVLLGLLLVACTEANPGFSPAVEGESGVPALDSGPASPDGEIIVLEAGVVPDLTPAPDTSAACGPAACPDGCCMDDGSCAPGISDWACGTGGASCAICGDGAACAAKQCVSLPPVTHQVLLVSASVLGGAWPVCFEGACDIYAELVFDGSKKAKSTAVDNNNSPVWSPPELLLEAEESALVGSSLVVTLYDWDYGPDQIVGTCDVALDAGTLAAGQVTVSCQLGSAVTPTATLTLGFAVKP